MAIYPELSTFDVTEEQDLAVTIAWKTSLIGLIKDEQATAPQTSGAYLAARLLDVVNSYTKQFVKLSTASELKVKIDTALERATPQQETNYKAFMLQEFAVDLEPKIPADSIKL